MRGEGRGVGALSGDGGIRSDAVIWSSRDDDVERVDGRVDRDDRDGRSSRGQWDAGGGGLASHTAALAVELGRMEARLTAYLDRLSTAVGDMATRLGRLEQQGRDAP